MEKRGSYPERSHHPYTNKQLSFRRVYKDHTFTKAESGSRQLHDPDWRRKEYEFRPDKALSDKEPNMRLERSHHPYTNKQLSFRHVYKDHTFTKAESGSRQLHDPDRRRKEYEFRPDKALSVKQPNMRLGEHFDLKKHLLEMIVTDLQTPTLVEEHGYRRFMNALNPSAYPALSASEMRKELVNMYVSTKRKVMDAIRTAIYPVLSAELWISSKEESYLTVTCHFIDNKWELKSYTLDTAQLLGEHTPENVHRQLWRISAEWEITEKIQVVVINVDGMQKVFQNSNWTYIPCFSHTLNKVILEVVASPDWRYLLKKWRHIVQFFHQKNEASWSDRLAQSSCVDWLSTLNMVETICKQWQNFSQLCSYKQVDNLWLNTNERELLENLTKTLTVVKDVTLEIGTCGYVQISNIIPLLVKLQFNLEKLIRTTV
ncbi:E3 SUMO-protein ligase ZBED1-like [Tachysurus vachellii]|uniref:E3 SUMO-protein ligase ZBED1-like n=1 Tax=Tachysurus vachellii TaxID=175792 RepID=UPI00296B2F7D|nr:E3 SUMO-protein ligase ZBED1-like [Tachysurus vachellii]